MFDWKQILKNDRDVKPDAKMVVYAVASASTGSVYVGRTKTGLKERWRHHVKNLRAGTHPNKALQDLYSRAGEDDLSVWVIEQAADEAELKRLEGQYQKQVEDTASDRLLCVERQGRRPQTPETRQKISDALKKRYKDPEVLQKHRERAAAMWEHQEYRQKQTATRNQGKTEAGGR